MKHPTQWSDLEKMKITIHQPDSKFSPTFDRSKEIFNRRRLSSKTWDDEIEEVREEVRLRKANQQKNMMQITGPGIYKCGKQALSCKIMTPDLCQIDFLKLDPVKSLKHLVPAKCTLKCPSSCIFFATSEEYTNNDENQRDRELAKRNSRPKRPKNGPTNQSTNIQAIVPSKVPANAIPKVTEIKEMVQRANTAWVGPGTYYCPSRESSATGCISLSLECKIDITDWTKMQYYSAYAETIGAEQKIVRRIPPGCKLSCPSSCSFSQHHEDIQTPASQNGKFAISPRNEDRNCIDPNSSVLPCPNIDIWQKCDKYNGGDFLSCYSVCKPSFCCIHDSKSVTYSPSCSKTYANCPLYSPCYIVWWYLHDSIGPATFANFQWSKQNEPFYDNSFSITAWRSELNRSPVFFQQFYGHHFDKETRPTDEEVKDPANW